MQQRFLHPRTPQPVGSDLGNWERTQLCLELLEGRRALPAKPSRWPIPSTTSRPCLAAPPPGAQRDNCPTQAAALSVPSSGSLRSAGSSCSCRRWGPPRACTRRCRSRTLPQPRAQTLAAKPATPAPSLPSLAPSSCRSQACRRSAGAMRLCGWQGAATTPAGGAPNVWPSGPAPERGGEPPAAAAS